MICLYFFERENVCEKTLLEPVAFQHQNSKGDCLHQCINAAICWSLLVITPHVIGSDAFSILPKRFSQQQLKWDNCIKEIACQQIFLTSWPNTYGNNNMTQSLILNTDIYLSLIGNIWSWSTSYMSERYAGFVLLVFLFVCLFFNISLCHVHTPMA